MSAAPAPPSLSIQWDETVCPLCGSRRSQPLLSARDPNLAPAGPLFRVVRCADCGLCFTNPRPDEASIGQFYPPDYEPHQPVTAPERAPQRKRRKAEGSAWERQALQLHGAGRLLDFGCGSGEFLARMTRQGWQATGLDISPAVVQRIREQLGLPALVGTLPHAEIAPESFDVVTMWQSLEHLHRPLAALQAVHAVLAPGGKLILSVPNFESGPVRLFGCGWYGLELPRHLTFFSPATLRQMVAQAGFAVERLEQLRHSDWIRRSVRLSLRLGCGPRWIRLLAIRMASSFVSRYWQLTGQSDCLFLVAVKR